MPDLRIVDPLALPLIQISRESAQWLIDSQTVEPAPAGIFAGLVPGKLAPKTPPELQRLGLVTPTTSTDTVDRAKIPYAQALSALASPNRRLSVALREGDESSTSTFFIKGRSVASGFVEGDARFLSASFSTALLSTGLSRQMTGPDEWHAAVLPKAASVLGRLFVRDRMVVSRSAAELKRELEPGGFEAIQAAQVVVKEGDLFSPAPDYARVLEALWSGHVMVLDISVFDTPPPDDRRSIVFVGAPGRRLWTYDEKLPGPGGQEVSVYRSLDSKTAAELAGAMVGI